MSTITATRPPTAGSPPVVTTLPLAAAAPGTSAFNNPWVRVAGIALGGAAVGGIAGMMMGGPAGALTGALIGGGLTFTVVVGGIMLAMRHMT